jgi:lipopolysaccharide export system permease protein
LKTLHLYLTRQVLATLGMTVFVFTLVLLLGNVIKEIRDLLVNRQATLGLAAHAILLLIPYVLAFSLPIGMLTATLLVFGRFSADQELTAARASGISLVSLTGPVLLTGVAVSGLCAWLNFHLAPSSRVAYKELLAAAVREGRRHPGSFLLNNQYVPFGKYQIFVGHVHGDGTNLDNVIVSEYDPGGALVRWAKSPTGVIIIDNDRKEISLFMPDMTSYERTKDGWTPMVNGNLPLDPVPFPSSDESLRIAISDMTFRQLQAELAKLEHGFESVQPLGSSKADLLAARKQTREAASQTMMPVLVYLNQQVAFSFACFGFTLIGIPLGIRAHRRETSVGVATALVLILVYYAFMVLGQAWASHPERYPCLIIWLPNFIFQAVGVVLLWRINRRIG